MQWFTFSWEGGPRGAAVRHTQDQRFVRIAVAAAVGRQLRAYWEQEDAAELPDRIAQLLTQLHEEPSSGSDEENRLHQYPLLRAFQLKR
jgi:hypothetical protein